MGDLTFCQNLDRFKESFLCAAAQGGNTQDCESLLEIGADVNWRNNDGDTPLLVASRRGHTDTVELLLVHGADVNAVSTSDSLNAVEICCKQGDHATLNVLLSANPTLSHVTKDGKTAFDIAKERGYEDICQRLSQLMNGRCDSARRDPIQHDAEALVNKQGSTSRGGGVKLPKVTREKSQEISAPKKTVDKKDAKETYTLMGQHNLAGHDESSVALRRQLEVEIKERKKVEDRIEMLKAEASDMFTSMTTLQRDYARLQSQHQSLQLDFDQAMGKQLQGLTLKQIDALEKKLKVSLDAIENRKAQLLEQELGHQKEQRLCVICQVLLYLIALFMLCQTEEKSVVLFPCRHMCLCPTCAENDEVDQCPLCRRPIIQRVSVYS